MCMYVQIIWKLTSASASHFASCYVDVKLRSPLPLSCGRGPALCLYQPLPPLSQVAHWRGERGHSLAGWLIIMPPQSRCNVEAYTMQYRKEVYKVTVQDCSFYISVNIYLRENWTQVSNNSTKTTHLEIRWSEVGICVKRFSQCKAKYISKTIYLHKVHWVYFFAK